MQDLIELFNKIDLYYSINTNTLSTQKYKYVFFDDKVFVTEHNNFMAIFTGEESTEYSLPKFNEVIAKYITSYNTFNDYKHKINEFKNKINFNEEYIFDIENSVIILHDKLYSINIYLYRQSFDIKKYEISISLYDMENNLVINTINDYIQLMNKKIEIKNEINDYVKHINSNHFYNMLKINKILNEYI